MGGFIYLQVFPYGSVPLKTYLPDGDIDLTAFGGANVEDKFAEDMKFVLEGEENNSSAEFVVKDVQLISAEVCISYLLLSIYFYVAMKVPSCSLHAYH